MVKIKSGEILSLDKSKQKTVAKQAKKLKKDIKEGKISIKEEKKAKKISVEQNRGLIYIGHIPHGFYENEMKNYFKQFGVVTNVKVCRSSKSGNSKGYGYVEFSHPDVAKIAADTMNNYLMFKKRITAEFVPYEKRPKGLFNGKGSTPTRFAAKSRRDRQMSANAMVDSKAHKKRSSSRLSTLAKKLRKLQDAGINYNFKPVHVPEGIKQEKSSSLNVAIPTHMADPYDSDIEVKIPLKKSTKSVASKSLSRKPSGKSKSPGKTLANKVLLAKSLDSVKALLSSPKPSSKASGLKATKSTKKVAKATSVDALRKNKKAKPKISRGITKKTKKPTPLNTDTVKKIAQELIRKRGDSILNVFTSTKKMSPSKKKSGKKS